MAKDVKDSKDAKKKPALGRGKWDLYDTSKELKRERKSCPKCGSGVFMAQHEDRVSCGRCGYTEFTKEKLIKIFPEHHKKEKPKEEKKEAPKAVEEAPAPKKK